RAARTGLEPDQPFRKWRSSSLAQRRPRLSAFADRPSASGIVPKAGMRRRVQARLLTRISPGPKVTVGRTMAWPTPDLRSASSTTALARKYAVGASCEALMTLTWTIRRTPARRAALNSCRLRSIAQAYVIGPRSKRIQKVLYSVSPPSDAGRTRTGERRAAGARA